MIRGCCWRVQSWANPSDAVRAAFSEYGENARHCLPGGGYPGRLLDQREHGKTVGKDAQEGKLTYVSLYGVEESKKRLAG